MKGTGMSAFMYAILCLVYLGFIHSAAGDTVPFLCRQLSGGMIALIMAGNFITEVFRRKRLFPRNIHDAVSLTGMVFFFCLYAISFFFRDSRMMAALPIFPVIVVIIAAVTSIADRQRNRHAYMEHLTRNPAQTILVSFFFLILSGCLLFMMPFATRDGTGMSFIDALFTATSAVCVTGLAVADTVTCFSFSGQLVLLFLIQAGGLGIMILTFFTVFLLRKRVSLADKMLLSYMLSEDDATGLFKALKTIVLTTFVIEGVGAVLLFAGFVPVLGVSVKNVWFSLFHAVSAFCNAGFSLFSDSLESFRRNPMIILTIALLIIAGGAGFSLISEVRQQFAGLLPRLNHARISYPVRRSLSVNNRIVLVATGILLIGGTLIFYILEHGTTMASYSLGEQYLAAFFQSVTFRTAGFNSVPMDALRPATYLFACCMMFIGAASGSTAGGIKVNTVAVLGAAVVSHLRGKRNVSISRYEIDNDRIIKAFIIFFSGILVTGLAVFLLSLTENLPFIHLVYEAFSAFGTTGVSAGITASLSIFSKSVLIVLMFWGRLGALTILAAAGKRPDNVKINHPLADVSIG